MVLIVGHQTIEADVYIAMKTPEVTANVLTNMILQLIFNTMFREKILTVSEAVRPSYPASITQAMLTYFIRFWDTVQINGEDIYLYILRNNLHPRTIEETLYIRLQNFASRDDFHNIHACHTLGVQRPANKHQTRSSGPTSTSSAAHTRQKPSTSSTNAKPPPAKALSNSKITTATKTPPEQEETTQTSEPQEGSLNVKRNEPGHSSNDEGIVVQLSPSSCSSEHVVYYIDAINRV